MFRVMRTKYSNKSTGMCGRINSKMDLKETRFEGVAGFIWLRIRSSRVFL
jgi:hypothetical protein